MIWDTDRSKSFESFLECYIAWKANARHDPEVEKYFDKMFTSRKFSNEKDRRKRRGPPPIKTDMLTLGSLMIMEDEFDCSGMCRASLFYFSKNITTSAMPKQSCLHEVKKYMMENGVPYATVCVMLSINCVCLAVVACGFLF